MAPESYVDVFDDFTARDWEPDGVDGEIRFAMIGLGWWTQDKAMPAVEESEYCTTTVAVSSTTEKAESVVAERDSIERGLSYDEYQDGAATDAYDAVYVCTPNALHLPYVEAAAKSGKAVLCEKPMEASVERAERLVEVCSAHDVPLMVAYRMHTEPAVRRARELIDDGFIGQPQIVHGHFSQVLLDLIPNPDQWRLDPELSGYGTSVMDIGVYPLNTTRFLLGSDPIAVQAMGASRGDAFGDVPDEVATFNIEFEDGVHAAFSASQNAHLSSYLRVAGTEGELEIEPAFDGEQQRSITLTKGESTVTHRVETVDQMLEEFDYFATCVLSEREPHPNGEHGLTDMRAVKAIYDSISRDDSVSVQ